MSQSDYISLKRISQELRNFSNNVPVIMSSRQYTDYKLYILAHTIPTTNPDFTLEILPGKTRVFDMERPVNLDCSSNYQLCVGTNLRLNRTAPGAYINSSYVAPSGINSNGISTGQYPRAKYSKYWNPNYSQKQNTDLLYLSVPGYMNHLKSVNYINTNLCDPANPGKYLCNNNVPITKKFLASQVYIPSKTHTYPNVAVSQTIYPNSIQKNASYSGYNNRRVAQNYARLLQTPAPAVPKVVLPFLDKRGTTKSYLF